MNYNDLVTVQIVLYQEDRDIILNNLKGLKNFKKIILDNSNDLKLKIEIEKKYPIEHYFIEKKNIGYSKGHNKCASFVNTKFLLILNADCFIDENNIIKLIKSFESYENIAIASPTTLDNNLEQTYNGGFFTENGDKSIVTKIDGDTCFQSVLGAAMLIKKDDFIEIGMFDENLFLYFSDDDLCKKFKKNNKAVMQIYSAKAHHTHGISKVKNFFKRIYFREFNFTHDGFYYFYKNYNQNKSFNEFKKKVPVYIIQFLLKIITLRFKKAIILYSRLLGYFKFKKKYF